MNDVGIQHNSMVVQRMSSAYRLIAVDTRKVHCAFRKNDDMRIDYTY